MWRKLSQADGHDRVRSSQRNEPDGCGLGISISIGANDGANCRMMLKQPGVGSINEELLNDACFFWVFFSISRSFFAVSVWKDGLTSRFHFHTEILFGGLNEPKRGLYCGDFAAGRELAQPTLPRFSPEEKLKFRCLMRLMRSAYGNGGRKKKNTG